MSSNIIEVKIALGIDTRIFVALSWSKLFSLIAQNKIYINFTAIFSKYLLSNAKCRSYFLRLLNCRRTIELVQDLTRKFK